MASIRKEFTVGRAPDLIWDAFADVGAVHRRLAAGFVTECKMVGEDVRLVTFANGMEVREVIVDVDPQRRRLAYSVNGGAASHHHASFEVLADGDGSRIIWTTDLLPHDLGPTFEMMMSQGVDAMGRSLQIPNSTQSG